MTLEILFSACAVVAMSYSLYVFTEQRLCLRGIVARRDRVRLNHPSRYEQAKDGFTDVAPPATLQ